MQYLPEKHKFTETMAECTRSAQVQARMHPNTGGGGVDKALTKKLFAIDSLAKGNDFS